MYFKITGYIKKKNNEYYLVNNIKTKKVEKLHAS
jgi:hypothetical protein